MKIRIALLSFFFTFCASIEAQNVFHQSYDFNVKDDEGKSITLTNDGGYFVCGNKTFGGNTMGFLKVDSLGIQKFHKSYNISSDDLDGGGLWPLGFYGFGAHFDSTEGAANSHFIFLKNNGDSLKILDINFQFNDRIHDAVLLQDSTFVVTGFYTDTLALDVKPYVARIDTLGNTLWFKTHNTANNIQETVTNIQATPDGGYVIGGVEEETPSGHLDLYLLKVDSVGNQEWKQLYNEPLSQRTGHVEVLSDGSYALFGTGYHPQGAQRALLKIDTAGNLLWRQKHGVLNLDEGYITGKELPNGNFICAGTSIRNHNGQNIDDVNLSLLDSAGSQLWSRDYNLHGQDINQYVRDLEITSDGGFVMTGFILNAPPGNRNDIFILKTDANGIITSLGKGFQEVDIASRAYPNPTTAEIIIPPVPEIEHIQVFNTNGQLVQTVNPSTLGETRFEIQGKKGVYILNILLEGGKVSTAKIIKN